MESLIENNAVFVLFHLLLEDYLPIDVDTSAGIYFLSFPLFVDPLPQCISLSSPRI